MPFPILKRNGLTECPTEKANVFSNGVIEIAATESRDCADRETEGEGGSTGSLNLTRKNRRYRTIVNGGLVRSRRVDGGLPNVEFNAD